MARLTDRLDAVVDPEDAAAMRAKAKANGVSVSTELRRAVKRHLSPQAYDDLAAVLEAAAERIRAKP